VTFGVEVFMKLDYGLCVVAVRDRFVAGSTGVTQRWSMVVSETVTLTVGGDHGVNLTAPGDVVAGPGSTSGHDPMSGEREDSS
jgi:hypothetical protein